MDGSDRSPQHRLSHHGQRRGSRGGFRFSAWGASPQITRDVKAVRAGTAQRMPRRDWSLFLGSESADRRPDRESERTSAPARHGRSASRESRIGSGCQTAMRRANARVMWNARGGGQRAMLYSSPGHPYQAPLRRLSVTRQVSEYTPAPTGSHRTGRTGDSSEATSLDGHHARRVSTLRDCVPVRAVASSRKPGHELPKSVSRQS